MIDTSRHPCVRAFLYNLIFLLARIDSEDSILTLTIFTFYPQIEITCHIYDSLEVYISMILGMANIGSFTTANFRAFFNHL